MKTLIRDIVIQVRNGLRTTITARVGVLLVSFIFAVMVSGIASVTTVGTRFASKVTIRLAKPALDSLAEKQANTDSTAKAALEEAKSISEEMSEARILQEKLVAALRRSVPKFDRSVRDMVKQSDEERLYEEENRELVKRLIGKKPKQGG